MPRFHVELTVASERRIAVWADDEQEAKEKAVEIVTKWDGVVSAEATDAERE